MRSNQIFRKMWKVAFFKMLKSTFFTIKCNLNQKIRIRDYVLRWSGSEYGSGSTDPIESGSEALLSRHDLIDMFVQTLEKKFGLEPGIIPEEEMPPEPAVCYSVN